MCEVVAEGKPTHVRRIGVRDSFGESGEERDLMEKYGLTWKHIADAARDVLKS